MCSCELTGHVGEVGLDHEDAGAGAFDDGEAGLGAGDFFELFADEPLEEVGGDVVLFGGGEVDEFVDLLGGAEFGVEGQLGGGFGGVEIVSRDGDGADDDFGAGVEHEFEELHGVFALFVGLLEVDLGQAEEAFAREVGGDAEVLMGVAEFVADLLVDRLADCFADEHRCFSKVMKRSKSAWDHTTDRG